MLDLKGNWGVVWYDLKKMEEDLTAVRENLLVLMMNENNIETSLTQDTIKAIKVDSESRLNSLEVLANNLKEDFFK